VLALLLYPLLVFVLVLLPLQPHSHWPWHKSLLAPVCLALVLLIYLLLLLPYALLHHSSPANTTNPY
jgi:uncharacterized membrane protein YoaK (UPF0700 family)